jgi:hypothetical protein
MLKAGTGSACFGGMPPTLGMLPYTKSNPKVLFGTHKKNKQKEGFPNQLKLVKAQST